ALIHQDSDFSARLHHPGNEQKPSLAWCAADLVGAEVTKNPDNRAAERWLNYYGRAPFQGISYAQAISNGVPTLLSVKDKVVFIGAGEGVAGYTGSEREQFRYPWTRLTGRFHMGVEVHALTFSNLVRQDWLSRMPTWLQVLTLTLSGLLLGYSLSLFR